MDLSYKVLTHEKVLQQINAVLASDPSNKGQLSNQIVTAYQKLKSNPFGADNVTFKENKHSKLIGKIRKIYVGGNCRYRLLNLCLPDKRIVIPVYFSTCLRKDLDYDKIEWQKLAEEIYEDFRTGNNKKFRIF